MKSEFLLLVSAEFAARSRYLRELLERSARTDGLRLARDVEQFLDGLDDLRRGAEAAGIYNNSSTPRELLSVEALNVKQAARVLGCTEQNISARCRRGSLDAHKDSGRWVIYL